MVDRLREIGAIGVRGNHDAAACGGSEIEWFNPEARRAMEWTRGAISAATVEWLAALPDRRTEGSCDLVHGSHREPLWEYVTSESDRPREPRGAGAGSAGSGSTATPTSRSPSSTTTAGWRCSAVARREPRWSSRGRRALVNPGSVGQPRDGDPDASYLIWDPEVGSDHVAPRGLRRRGRAARPCATPACRPSLAARLGVGL